MATRSRIAKLLADFFLPGTFERLAVARRRRAAKRSRQVAPSAARTGERCCVVGRAVPLEVPLVATFSREPAVFHDIVEHHKEIVAVNAVGWHEYRSEASTAPFFVVGDDDSRLLVEPSVAMHTLEYDEVFAAEMVRRYEARVAPGDRIAVFGIVEDIATPGREGYRGGAGTMPRMRGTETEPIVIALAR